jgi:hypothetical protein
VQERRAVTGSPLRIRIADENGQVTRLARALLTINDYFHADPGRLNNLADLTAFAATKVGDDEIARTLATLRQPSLPSCREAPAPL